MVLINLMRKIKKKHCTCQVISIGYCQQYALVVQLVQHLWYGFKIIKDGIGVFFGSTMAMLLGAIIFCARLPWYTIFVIKGSSAITVFFQCGRSLKNQEFFWAYHLRLMVKDQIERFNDLLERPVEEMQMYPIRSISMSNGSQIRQIPRNPTYQATNHAGPNVKRENMHQSANANLSQVYTEPRSLLDSGIGLNRAPGIGDISGSSSL